MAPRRGTGAFTQSFCLLLPSLLRAAARKRWRVPGPPAPPLCARARPRALRTGTFPVTVQGEGFLWFLLSLYVVFFFLVQIYALKFFIFITFRVWYIVFLPCQSLTVHV